MVELVGRKGTKNGSIWCGLQTSSGIINLDHFCIIFPFLGSCVFLFCGTKIGAVLFILIDISYYDYGGNFFLIVWMRLIYLFLLFS